MPGCWTQSQLIEKIKTYLWLLVRNRKPSFKTGRNVKNIKTDGIHLSSACLSRSHRSFEVKSAGVFEKKICSNTETQAGTSQQNVY